MAILHIENKRWLTPLRAFLIFVAAAGIATYLMWPEGQASRSPKTIVTASVLSPSELPGKLDSSNSGVVGQKSPGDVTDSDAPDSSIDEGVTPPNGADAVVASNSGKETDLREPSDCLDTETLSTQEIFNLLPPKGEPDACAYGEYLSIRRDATPEELFEMLDRGAIKRLDNLHVEYAIRNAWSTWDLEQLAARPYATLAGLELYLVLKKRGSPVAAEMLIRHPEWLIKKYLTPSEECPDFNDGIKELLC